MTGASKRNSPVSPVEDALHHTDTHGRSTAYSDMHGFLMAHYTFVSVDSSIKFKSGFIRPNSEIRKRVSRDLQKPQSSIGQPGLSLFIAQSSLGAYGFHFLCHKMRLVLVETPITLILWTKHVTRLSPLCTFLVLLTFADGGGQCICTGVN